MKIAVLDTSPVGQSVAARLDELGHQVTVGTRDVEATIARIEPDSFGRPPLAQWAGQRPGVTVASAPEVAAIAELVINATNGASSITTLEAAAEENLAGEVLIGSANPLFNVKVVR